MGAKTDREALAAYEKHCTTTGIAPNENERSAWLKEWQNLEEENRQDRVDAEREGGKMAEIPEHVKAQADAAVASTGAEKMPVKNMGEPQGVDSYDTKGLEAQRERQRQDAQQEKTPEPTPDPNKDPDKT
jgi:hypothetical protein